MKPMKGLFVLLGSLGLGACAASTPGARPTDMSAAGHEAAAQGHQQEAAAHAAQFDPAAKVETTKCRSAGKPANPEPCWTASENPTAAHLAEAERHQKMAADHRQGSKALRDAEESACRGLAENDRNMSPFAHREDVAGVQELRRAPTSAKVGPPPSVVGASVTLRAVPGLTREYLERLVGCHTARNASMGFAMPEMSYCPLAVKGATASVESVTGGFRIDVKSDDPGAAQEIVRRAEALTPSAPAK